MVFWFWLLGFFRFLVCLVFFCFFLFFFFFLEGRRYLNLVSVLQSIVYSWTDPILLWIFPRVCYKKKLVFLMMNYGNKCNKGGLNAIFSNLCLTFFPFFLCSKYSAEQLEELLTLLNIIAYIDLKWTFYTQAHEYRIRVHSVLSNPIDSKHKRITGHLCIHSGKFCLYT